MSQNTSRGYVLFHTSAAAFMAEKLARSSDIVGVRLVPVPRELSSDCGVALRFELSSQACPVRTDEPSDASDDAAIKAMKQLLGKASIPYERIERL